MPTTVFKPKKIKFLWKLFFYSLLLFFCLNEHLVGQQLENEEAYNQIHMLRIKQENDLYQYWYKCIRIGQKCIKIGQKRSFSIALRDIVTILGSLNAN